MAFKGAGVNASVDNKFRLIIPSEIIEARNIGDFVELVNREAGGRLITRIYYHDSGIRKALRVKLSKSKESFRVTLVKAIREESLSFFYGRYVMLVDKGRYMEILPWPPT
jgi:bifunctional DNA-binding transcriptional regulator/antitoxin component of YhaV-PrlF toxin-antitoxin module